MIQITEATSQDYILIQQIAHQTWPDTFSDILSPAQIAYMLVMMYSMSALTEQMEEKGYTFLLAKEEDKYLGFAAYELNYQGLAKTKLHKIYILPKAQGKGLGKLLITHVAEIAVQNQTEVVSLNVNRNNPAINFYEKLGFKKVMEENIPIGEGFYMEDFVMDKKLTTAKLAN